MFETITENNGFPEKTDWLLMQTWNIYDFPQDKQLNVV